MSIRNLKVIPLPILSCDLGNRNSIFSLKFQLCICAKLFQLVSNSATIWTIGLEGSSVQGILQEKILEWIAMPSSR